MREPRRPALFENLVFGLALVLLLIVTFYAARSLLPSGGAARRGVPEPAATVTTPLRVREKHELVSSGTQQAVGSLPPVRVSRTGRKPPKIVPPPPKKD